MIHLENAPDLASQFGVWAPLVSFAVALLATIASRLIDRYLPDTQHPIPEIPPTQYRGGYQQIGTTVDGAVILNDPTSDGEVD